MKNYLLLAQIWWILGSLDGSLDDKDTVGVNIRKGTTPMYPNFDFFGESEWDEADFWHYMDA